VKIEKLELDNLVVRVIRSGRKTLSLEISHEGLMARAPMYMQAQSIIEFVQHKRHWIDKHLHNIPAIVPPLDLVTGTKLPFQGESVSLKLALNTRGLSIPFRHRNQH